MIKRHLHAITLVFLFLTSGINAQIDFNLELVSNLDYDQNCNDIWAWVADDGTEYAILGTITGTAIISLEDPTDPQEVQFIPGVQSLWRDMKSWGDYVYVTADVGSDGLLVIDMSGAPENITWDFWRPRLEVNNAQDTLRKCHNLYIDENGYAYLTGCNLNSGGPLIVDVHTTPGEPIFIGGTDPRYAHDVYARGDTLYSSDINVGAFSIIDVSDKENPVTIAMQETSFRFTHNAWISDNGQFLFTTDERANAFIDAYDISDVENIFETDRYRPLDSEGMGVIPHNVHVIDDYLVISYYTDGVKVVDASNPYNLVEVGSYNTYPLPPGGFNGCWGAYPWLPSGLMLASDINTGLYVLRPEYVRAARIEGTVTDAVNGAALNDVDVVISSEQTAFAKSNNAGDYKSGLGIPGTYDVTFSKAGYSPMTVEVAFVSSETIMLDVALQPLAKFALSGVVLEAGTNNPIPRAQVQFEGIGIEINERVVADEDGVFQLEVFEGDYELLVGAWGYKYAISAFDDFQNDDDITVLLEKGYVDDFVFDYGWEVTGEASAGEWERGVPQATFLQGVLSNPAAAYEDALGNQCYVTGPEAGGGVGDFDLDDGTTILTSPELDLSEYDNPTVKYARWFINGGGAGQPNDTLKVFVSDGDQEVLLEMVWGITNGWELSPEFEFKDEVDLTKPVRFIFIASDLPGSGHIVEAAVDFFSVYEGISTSTEENTISESLITVFPNPSSNGQVYVDFSQIDTARGILTVKDLQGRVMSTETLDFISGVRTLNIRSLISGVYFICFEEENGQMHHSKLIVK